MDIAKRLIDYVSSLHTAFPLIVAGAMMIDPRIGIQGRMRLFIDAMKSIAEEAATKPEM